ncbi:MAG: Succinate dehydrogenase cytochrome b558 subunit [Candidatus Anoxychlamydiales bacterium]|nr:Succinate dehydrogenase cytochrome b558 subunit [Candidatus Anoxychlamydiales bacterium]
MQDRAIPAAFFFRRVQSLTGFFLVLFLLEHLFTNSTAALFLDEGSFFVKSVSIFQSIPYLNVVEIVLIGLPILLHAFLGVRYLITGDLNSFKTDGRKPALYKFKRNKAYSWQRITSYILAIGLVFHIVQMRFLDKPKKVMLNNSTFYFVKIKKDDKLEKLSKKMDITIYSKDEISTLGEKFQNIKIKDSEVLAFSKNSGAAFLLEVRNTFKNPFMVGIYSIFVLAACFHAMNGFWTFLMTWGFIITNRSQRISLSICFWIMLFIMSLGFVSIWSSYLY